MKLILTTSDFIWLINGSFHNMMHPVSRARFYAAAAATEMAQDTHAAMSCIITVVRLGFIFLSFMISSEYKNCQQFSVIDRDLQKKYRVRSCSATILQSIMNPSKGFLQRYRLNLIRLQCKFIKKKHKNKPQSMKRVSINHLTLSTAQHSECYTTA